MFIERKIQRSNTGAIIDLYYLTGAAIRIEADALVVQVDGKTVAADVVRLDTEEGWVDVELPEIDGQNKMITNESTVLVNTTKPGTLPPDVSFFTPKVKRLVGHVRAFKK